jgi:protein-serine/threonine kinase
MASAEHRLDVDQIKQHFFFYGVDWDSIRQIDAPFVPHLRSITDTSYFPTDEIDQAPEEPAAAESQASKDLAFLGYVSDLILSLIGSNSISSRYTFKRFTISGHS